MEALRSGASQWFLKKMTIQYCRYGGSSKGTRAFLLSGLLNFAKENPQIDIVARSITGNKHPHVICEYDNGFIHTHHLRNMEPSDIMGVLHTVRNRRGRLSRQLKLWPEAKSKIRSVQGQWIPGLFATKYADLIPDKDQVVETPKTPTLRQLAEAQGIRSKKVPILLGEGGVAGPGSPAFFSSEMEKKKNSSGKVQVAPPPLHQIVEEYSKPVGPPVKKKVQKPKKDTTRGGRRKAAEAEAAAAAAAVAAGVSVDGGSVSSNPAKDGAPSSSSSA